jgi:protoheme IX farnesyltransferase
LSVWRQFNALTKPRVIQLIVFCALIGMVLAVPGVPGWADALRMVLASAGIWFVAGAAAAFNCLVEKGIDARMKRTAWRPTAPVRRRGYGQYAARPRAGLEGGARRQ